MEAEFDGCISDDPVADVAILDAGEGANEIQAEAGARVHAGFRAAIVAKEHLFGVGQAGGVGEVADLEGGLGMAGVVSGGLGFNLDAGTRQ